MHNAPSVAYPVGRCAFQRWIWCGLALTSAVVLCLWALQQPMSWGWWVGLFSTSVGLWWGWRANPSSGATVHWDGQTWSLRGVDAAAVDVPGHLHVALDVQHTLLLAWQPLSANCFRTRWLWLGREHAPERWHDLRCAVYQGAPLH